MTGGEEAERETQVEEESDEDSTSDGKIWDEASMG